MSAVMQSGFVAALHWLYSDTADYLPMNAADFKKAIKSKNFDDGFIADLHAMRAAYQALPKYVLRNISP